MKCVECGCTDRAACSGGCFWVAPNVCSKCLPQDLDASCRGCDNMFGFTIQEPDRITVSQGEGGKSEFENPENIECPDCGSTDLYILQFHKYTVSGNCSKCGNTINGGEKAVVVQKTDSTEFREDDGSVKIDSFEVDDSEFYHRSCYTDQDEIPDSKERSGGVE